MERQMIRFQLLVAAILGLGAAVLCAQPPRPDQGGQERGDQPAPRDDQPPPRGDQPPPREDGEGPPRTQEGRFGRRPNPLMEALDTNQDGELSAEEIASAPASLKKLDKNGDGKLTEDELRPQGQGGGRRRG